MIIKTLSTYNQQAYDLSIFQNKKSMTDRESKSEQKEINQNSKPKKPYRLSVKHVAGGA